jgi:hypothetical protein
MTKAKVAKPKAAKHCAGSPCINHRERPAECPQAHVCVCGKSLAEHWTIDLLCHRTQSYARFMPSDSTLAKFPEQYSKGGTP